MLIRHAVISVMCVSSLAFSQSETPAHRVDSGLAGVGVLHVGSAQLGQAKQFRFSLIGEYFRQGDFPIQNALHTHWAGNLSVSYVLNSNWEFFVSYQPQSNINTRSTPSAIRNFADAVVGAKWAQALGSGFYGGVELTGRSFSGLTGSPAFGLAPKALLTWDAANLPLRLHANVGAAFDNTSSLLASGQLIASEEYSLNINRYSRLTAAAALEIPLPGITPYFEYNMAYPLGVPGGKLVGPDGLSQSISAILPQTLGVGLKVTAIRQVMLLAGADFGTTSLVGLGVPAVPMWNAYVGAAFQLDAAPVEKAPDEAPIAPPPAPVVEEMPEPPPAPEPLPEPAPAPIPEPSEEPTSDFESEDEAEAKQPEPAPAPAPIAEPAPEPEASEAEVQQTKGRRAAGNVHFAAGKADIKSTFFARLDRLAKKLSSNAIRRIRIEGHADNLGDKSRNEELANERALAVKQYLVDKGIDASRMDVASFGDDRPLVPNNSPKNRLKNRRVEIFVAK